MTYNLLWKDGIAVASTIMLNQLDKYIAIREHLILDRTNLTVKSRQSFLKKLPDDYRKIAIILETPPADVHRFRLNNRPGKVIPDEVIDNMAKSYVQPTLAEGFNEVRWVQYKES
jgi:predicted kinase